MRRCISPYGTISCRWSRCCIRDVDIIEGYVPVGLTRHDARAQLLVKAGVDLRVLDGRSLNCYHLARWCSLSLDQWARTSVHLFSPVCLASLLPYRSLLGTQSEITKFLAQIMEKVVPGVRTRQFPLMPCVDDILLLTRLAQSTEIKPAGQEVQAHTHPDALRTHPVDASSTTPTAAGSHYLAFLFHCSIPNDIVVRGTERTSRGGLPP